MVMADFHKQRVAPISPPADHVERSPCIAFTISSTIFFASAKSITAMP